MLLRSQVLPCLDPVRVTGRSLLLRVSADSSASRFRHILFEDAYMPWMPLELLRCNGATVPSSRGESEARRALCAWLLLALIPVRVLGSAALL